MSESYTVEDLAAFAVAATSSDLTADAPKLLRRNILDSIGCAIAALDGEAVRAVREHIESTGAAPHAAMIGGGRTSVDQAALFNSVAVRYVDQLDTYLTPGGLCHPADNFGAILAVAEHTRATGAEFILALAVAYEVQCRFSAAVPVMAHGLNHALQLAMSVAAGSAKLMHLSVEQTANAIAAAAVDNVSLAAIHSEPVSNWKGISPGITAQRAVYITWLARRDITGPRSIFEGPNGLAQLFDQAIDLHLDDPTLGVVTNTYLKKYCALIHAQAAIETALVLAHQRRIAPADVESVDVEIFQNAYELAGGGAFGDKDAPLTKEQADYNLKYLLAAAFIDGQLGPEQLQTERIRRPDVQALLHHIKIRPDTNLTAGYPQTTPVRITVRLRDGRTFRREQKDFEGAPSRPLTWERIVQKFHWLAQQHAGDDQREAIVLTVERLGDEPVSALAQLLSEVSTEPRLPRKHKPI